MRKLCSILFLIILITNSFSFDIEEKKRYVEEFLKKYKGIEKDQIERFYIGEREYKSFNQEFIIEISAFLKGEKGHYEFKFYEKDGELEGFADNISYSKEKKRRAEQTNED